MLPFEIGLLALAAMAVLVFIGMYVAVAMILCSFVGVWAIKGSPELAAKMLGLAANEVISSYFFGVVPLFVFMGFLVAETGMGRDAFDVANTLSKKIKGGLAVGTIGANAIFAAVTGISIASAAVFSKIALPELDRHGYSKRFAVGVVAGSSLLGMLIPPSLLLILFGLLAEQSIGDLFLAGIGPGLLLATLFSLGTVLMAVFFPDFVGRHLSSDSSALSTMEMISKALPLAVLIAFVLGGIYTGWITPVEAGAVGAIGAIVVGLAKRKLTPAVFWRVLLETGAVTAAVCFLIIAAQMYSRMLAFSGLPNHFGQLILSGNLDATQLIVIYSLVVILFGMILDSSSIMLILVPLMLPIVVPMGVDLIWFGIVTVIAVEIGLLTPPFGISVYVIKSTINDPDVSLQDIFIGAAPFALIMLVCLASVIAFPPIALGLVGN